MYGEFLGGFNIWNNEMSSGEYPLTLLSCPITDKGKGNPPHFFFVFADFFFGDGLKKYKIFQPLKAGIFIQFWNF